MTAKHQEQTRWEKGARFSLPATVVMVPYVPLVHLRQDDLTVGDLLGVQRKQQAVQPERNLGQV